MLDLGGDVRERGQDEAALVQQRMGDLERVVGDDLVSVQENVDVERP